METPEERRRSEKEQEEKEDKAWEQYCKTKPYFPEQEQEYE